jgi:hypothetical protein
MDSAINWSEAEGNPGHLPLSAFRFGKIFTMADLQPM